MRKVVEYNIFYKFGLRQYFIELRVLEIEREEWEGLSHMYEIAR